MIPSKTVFHLAACSTAALLVACSTASAQGKPLKVDPKPAGSAVRAQIVFTDVDEDTGNATACFADIPEFVHVPAGKTQVRFVLVNLCNGVNIDDVEINGFNGSTASNNLCSGITTTGQPFTRPRGNGKPGKAHQTRRGVAIQFDVATTATGCWKYNVVIKEQGGQSTTIDPVIRIDR